MNLGKYNSDLKNTIKILEEYSLLGEQNLNNIKNNKSTKYSKQSKVLSREHNYFEFYKYLVENTEYDIILIDNSILQFSYDTNVLRYAFYPSPDELDYNGFLKENFNTNYESVGDEFRDMYSDYVMQLSDYTSITPIRYDFDEKLYVEGEHSASHIHFGFVKDFKVNCDKKIIPSLFVLYVIQNYYYDRWKNNKDIYTKYVRNLKRQCEGLEDSIFTELDKQMIYIK